MTRSHLRNLLLLVILGGLLWRLPWLPDQDEVVYPKQGSWRPGETLQVQEDTTVRLKDGHFLNLAAGSKVTLQSHRRTVFGSYRQQTIRVDQGRVYLSGKGDRDAFLRLETPYSSAGIRGTAMALSVQDGGSASSVHEGTVTSGQQSLRVGQGSVSSKPGPQNLPSSPLLLGPAANHELREPTWFVWRGQAWAYRLELARDGQFQQILWSGRVTGNQARLPLLDEDTPIHVRLFALRQDGLESLPSLPAEYEYRLHQQLAARQLQRGKPELALAELERARPNFPQDWRLLREEGWAHYLQGDHAKAEQFLRRALVAQPGEGETRSKLARVLFWRKSYAESARLYLALIQETPRDADQHWGLAEVYAGQGLQARARQEAEACLQIDPFHPYAPLVLANCLRAQRPQQARQVLLRYLGLREAEGDLFLRARQKAYGAP